MHDWVYEKAECLKNEIVSKGFDNLSHENLEEAAYISKILKNIIYVDREYHIIEAMEKSEYGKDYDENGRLYYSNRRRMDDDYKMDIEDYKRNTAMELRERDRARGRMYYSEDSKYEMMKKAFHEKNDMASLEEWLDETFMELENVMPMMNAQQKNLAKTKITNFANSKIR